jgi:hypothetical protein
MLPKNLIHQNLPSFIRRVFVLLVGRVLHRVFEPLCRIWRMVVGRDPIMNAVVYKSAFRTCIRRCSGQALGSSGMATHVLQVVDSSSSQRPKEQRE